MFENMAMINEIASYRERDVNYSGVGLAGTIAPVSNAGAGAIGVDERHAIHEDTLGEDLIWHICLIEFRRRYDAESDLMNVEIVILAAWQSKNVSTSTSRTPSNPRRPKGGDDIAGSIGKAAPIGPKLKRHHDACYHSHAEGNSEDPQPELRKV
jgi:hypothetical protein